MISNAIAEMRSYGEGFIIVDQSPGLMDMSVMRNTNTKMILRLPESGDGRWWAIQWVSPGSRFMSSPA